jgi:hypothetical protein
MVTFHSYVSLPEGSTCKKHILSTQSLKRFPELSMRGIYLADVHMSFPGQLAECVVLGAGEQPCQAGFME